METETILGNPYYQEAEAVDFRSYGNNIDYLYANKIPIVNHREELAKKYAWAIPNDGAISLIASLLMPIVEIGAGTGYWARLLFDVGVDIVAFDERPHKNHWCDGNWFNVLEGGAEISSNYPDRALMLCWPPYDDDMAYDSLMNYAGNTVIYIGEGYGGCTAGDRFHEELDKGWILDYKHIIPQWDGIHDKLFIYRRKTYLALTPLSFSVKDSERK